MTYEVDENELYAQADLEKVSRSTTERKSIEPKPYGVTVHSLRKTYAYTLKSSNIHVTTASKLMGHSNPMVTLKIYTQVLDEEIGTSGKAILEYMKETASRKQAATINKT